MVRRKAGSSPGGEREGSIREREMCLKGTGLVNEVDGSLSNFEKWSIGLMRDRVRIDLRKEGCYGPKVRSLLYVIG